MIFSFPVKFNIQIIIFACKGQGRSLLKVSVNHLEFRLSYPSIHPCTIRPETNSNDFGGFWN